MGEERMISAMRTSVYSCTPELTPFARARRSLPSVVLSSCRVAPFVTSELHTHDLRHARLLHGDAIHHRSGTHRALVVRDDDELRLRRHLADQFDEAPHVSVIQRRIDFVENAER